MRDCKVDDNLVLKLVEQLLALDSFEIERLDLSLNHLTDEACTHLAALLTTDKKIKELNLSENIQITNEGLKEIVKCSKQNRHLHCLQFQQCSIELGRTGWQGILDDVQNNCSLT
jgi:Ran GTPase-activating protein (RanGAP) involved in mRNA processing and transport